MIICNSMESIVRDEMARESARSEGMGFCRCPLCEADVLALALTTLPPQYCSSRPHRVPRDGSLFHLVRLRIGEAIERVRLNPKHGGRNGKDGPLSPKIVNFNFQEGVAALPAVMEEYSDACTCDQCRADTLALALNRYPPKYGVDLEGAVVLPPKEREAIRRELSLMMIHAVDLVAGQPRHGLEGSA